jgi:hypothetical protein
MTPVLPRPLAPAQQTARDVLLIAAIVAILAGLIFVFLCWNGLHQIDVSGFDGDGH